MSMLIVEFSSNVFFVAVNLAQERLRAQKKSSNILQQLRLMCIRLVPLAIQDPIPCLSINHYQDFPEGLGVAVKDMSHLHL